MTSLAWVGLAIGIFGLVLPAWTFLAIAFHAGNKPKRVDPGIRFTNYAAVVDRLFAEMDKERNKAAIILAAFRELREFPEYRDISIALLGVIDVTGISLNDHMLMDELKATEDFLLERNHP